jgi:hypothetical protein
LFHLSCFQMKTEKEFEIDFESFPENVFKTFFNHSDGNTLLNLSLTCKHVRKLVLTSDGFFKKIQLTVDCANFKGLKALTLNCFAADLEFKAFKIIHLHQALNNFEIKNAFQWLVKRLGRTVEELRLDKSTISGDQLNEILQRVHDLKTISLVNTKIQSGSKPLPMMNKLSSMYSKKSSGITLFDNIQLTKLDFYCFGNTRLKSELKIFLQSQQNLLVLNTDVCIFQPPEVLPKFQLSEFTLKQTRVQSVNLVRLNEFLVTQKSLKFLRFFMGKISLLEAEPLLRVLSTICLRLVNLQELEISLREDSSIPHLDKTLRELVQLKFRNKIVKKLKIRQKFCEFGFISALINIFENLKEINLELAAPSHLKIFDNLMKFEAFNIIKITGVTLKTFKYSTETAPKDRKAFEENIGNFLTHNGNNLRKVSIGHSNWNSNDDSSFQLSQAFCENLIKLPKLKKLELFAVDRIFKPLSTFFENQNESKLKVVKLHKERPIDNDGRAAKRLKMEVSF